MYSPHKASREAQLPERHRIDIGSNKASMDAEWHFLWKYALAATQRNYARPVNRTVTKAGQADAKLQEGGLQDSHGSEMHTRVQR